LAEIYNQNLAFFWIVINQTFVQFQFPWTIRKRINSWGSMFALPAIYWKENFENNTFDSMIDVLY